MKTTPFKGVIENAYGKALPTPIKYAGEFEALVYDESKAKAVEPTFSFDGVGDVIPAKELPNLADIYANANNARKANARQKAMAAALTAAGIEKPTLENPEEQFKQMVKILVTAGKSEDDAKQMANANLGTSY